jgi:diguanylate cyclase (GGDEF)-like protein
MWGQLVGLVALVRVRPDAHDLVVDTLASESATLPPWPEDASAWEHFRDPVLVVLDWEDGEEARTLCARLRQRPGTDLVMVVPDRSVAALEAALEAGASDVLPRPLVGIEVKSRLEARARLLRQAETLRRWARVDPDTGLPDQEAFEARLTEEWWRTNREARPLAVLVVGLDRGGAADSPADPHPRTSLMAIARAVQQCANRAGDLTGRFGQDGFACLMPDTDVPGALSVGQRILDQVRSLRAGTDPVDPEGVPTVSVGFAAAFPSHLLGPEELLFRACRNMGRAQARGGDRWSSGEEG